MKTITHEEVCEQCNSLNVMFDSQHGFYRCLACGYVWANDEDDPDYDEYLEDESRQIGSIWGFRNAQTGETWDM
jgi:transcription initiation factor TFIIIB Brf1 subunit/transcription initiation factor TFIIB